MFTSLTTAAVILVIFAAFLFLARRIFRLALKLALVGAVIFALFGGAMFGWWRGWFGSSSQTQRPTSTSTQPRNSNRRPSPR